MLLGCSRSFAPSTQACPAQSFHIICFAPCSSCVRAPLQQAIAHESHDSRELQSMSDQALEQAGAEYGAAPSNLHHLKRQQDRKSTRLNSSHVKISYTVFCL